MNKKKLKIAIANRGEVAVRIHRAIKKLGHTSLLLHSKPDENSIAYRTCDESFCIGEGPSSESYLNIQNVIQGALKSEADALHPGFGFLSENADFAKACAEAGLVFIGPSPDSMNLFGDKISAKDFCEKQNVPTLKSYRGEDQSLDRLLKEAKGIGFPVLIKAAAGGGGRGMRVVHTEAEVKSNLESAKSEALKAFGSESVFLERYLPVSKHIEVQIFGDANGEVHVLGERECSVQRRHQKIIEEALSSSLTETQKQEVYTYAKKLTQEAQYKNAGTVEFLFAEGKFFFLEVNTRLQVEHPVTEEVFGIDLVEAQIKTAVGESITWSKELKAQPLHSIECRIYAEDLKGFPFIGKIGSFSLFQEEKGIRIEQGFERGDQITTHYDSMIAKAIYTDQTRELAIQKAVRSLQKSHVTGIQTNIPLLIQILEHKDFQNSTMTTLFFSENFKDGLKAPFTDEEIDDMILKSKRNTKGQSLYSKSWRGSL